MNGIDGDFALPPKTSPDISHSLSRALRVVTYLECVARLVASLAGDNSNAVDERNYLGRILLLEFDLRVEELETLDSRFAPIVESQVLRVPPFLLMDMQQVN